MQHEGAGAVNVAGGVVFGIAGRGLTYYLDIEGVTFEVGYSTWSQFNEGEAVNIHYMRDSRGILLLEHVE